MSYTVRYQFFIFNKYICVCVFVCVCVCVKNLLLWFCICTGVVIYITLAVSILDPFTFKHKAYIHMKGSVTFCF